MPLDLAAYHRTCREFRLEAPARFNWAFDTFDGWARDPARLGLLWVSADGQPRRFTFAELADRSRRFANALAGLGVARGDRVFVMLPRVYQWREIVLGSIRACAVSAPGTTLLTPKDVQYRVSTQRFATLFDGITGHSPEGVWFKRRTEEVGFKQAVRERDGGEPIAPAASRPLAPWRKPGD